MIRASLLALPLGRAVTKPTRLISTSVPKSNEVAPKKPANSSQATPVQTLESLPSLSAELESIQTSENISTLSSLDAFHGLSSAAFSDQVSEILLADLEPNDVEMKPDGLLYLPEIKYRRILNRAFKPGGWALVPRGPHSFSGKNISREYALFAFGRFVSQARGEQDVFDEKMLPTAIEGCKSNALMRCCKDLGIASELWDPAFIREFKAKRCENVWVRHVGRNTKLKIWKKKDVGVDYPYELLS